MTTRGIIRLVEPATGVAVAFCRIDLEDHPRWRDAAVRRKRIGVIVTDMLSYDYAKDKDEYLRIDGAELGICRLAIRLTPDGSGIATIY